MADTSTAKRSLSKGKKLLFTGILVALPVLFFVLLELVLRIADYGDYPALFTEVPRYENYLQPSDDVAQRYFASDTGIPGIPFDSFLKNKDEGSLRIFVQGGSTAAGYPFYFGGGFTDMLEQRLLQTFPGRTVEVVGTAMAAVNSYTLLDFVDEIIDQAPDAIVIYAGHNEYYGALGVGSAESLGRNPGLVRFVLRIQRFRTVQLVRSGLAAIASALARETSNEGSAQTLMQRMVDSQSIPLDSPLYDSGVHQFTSNMDLLLEMYDKAGIPVFIGTVASNLRDQDPFISSQPTDAIAASEWTAQWSDIENDLTTNPESALRKLLALESVDSLSADVFYARGSARIASGGDSTLARLELLRAKELDQLRFRAPEEINSQIRALATRHNAQIVETADALASVSSIGVPGKEVMTEHLHPNSTGFFLIADAFYEALIESQLFGETVNYIASNDAQDESLLTEVDSLVALYRVQTLTASWPFQPVGAKRQALDTLGTGVPAELALKLFQRSIPRAEALDHLRAYYSNQGDSRAALKVVLALIQRYPFWPNPYLSASSIMMNMGQFEEALVYSQASNDRGESADALRLIGALHLRLEQPTEAVPPLKRSLELEPNDIGAMYNLAGAYALLAEFAEARRLVDQILKLKPDHVAAARLKSSLPR